MRTIYVKSLAEAEKIVAKNPQLSWRGWDIVHSRKDTEAFRKVTGAFDGEKWINKTVISPTRDGWAIPREYIR